MVVDVIIPALNEEAAVAGVVRGLCDPRIRRTVVVDNGSTDATAARAAAAGAVVVREPRRGYGSACLAGIAVLAGDAPDAVLFLDADAADDPADIPALLDAISQGYDLVVGSRIELAAPGALPPVARFGNWLATALVDRLFGHRYTDLGPLRVIRWDALRSLAMRDPNFGWTVEMQARAAKRRLRCAEVPVRYRRRVGTSKISGTVLGSIRAGQKILWTIARERLLG